MTELGVLARITDRIRALEDQVEAVLILHSPQTRFTPYGSEDLSFETRGEAQEYLGDGGEVLEFTVCTHCGDLETGADTRREFEASLWPCQTAETLGVTG